MGIARFKNTLFWIIVAVIAFHLIDAKAETQTMFIFEHREDLTTAIENTGKDYPEISEFRQVQYIGTFDTETKAIIIQKSFVGDSTEAPPDVDFIPVPPDTVIEPPVIFCNPYEGTSKSEVNGLLTRIENFYKNRTDAEAAFAWGKSMFFDEESILLRVKAIKTLIYGCPE